VVSHDRRLLEQICDRLWVLEPGAAGQPAQAAEYDGSYRQWRADLASGWTVAAELARTAHRHAPTAGSPVRREAAPLSRARLERSAGAAVGRPGSTAGAGKTSPRLSKEAYRRQSRAVEDDLTRLGLRKNQLELALTDPKVQANFVELRRLTSELADVDGALSQAEDAWLALAERAPR